MSLPSPAQLNLPGGFAFARTSCSRGSTERGARGSQSYTTPLKRLRCASTRAALPVGASAQIGLCQLCRFAALRQRCRQPSSPGEPVLSWQSCLVEPEREEVGAGWAGAGTMSRSLPSLQSGSLPRGGACVLWTVLSSPAHVWAAPCPQSTVQASVAFRDVLWPGSSPQAVPAASPAGEVVTAPPALNGGCKRCSERAPSPPAHHSLLLPGQHFSQTPTMAASTSWEARTRKA